MQIRIRLILVVLFLALSPVLTAQDLDWKAGVAQAVITPDKPLWMAGYAGRKTPAEGKEQDLFAKALALEDSAGARFIMITMDLITVSRPMRDSLEAAIAKRHGLPSSALLLNCSHTHCGPEIRVRREDNRSIYPSDPEVMIDYYKWLEARLNSLIDEALNDLSPARLLYGRARCGFAMNRRLPTERGFINSPNPDGPVDHDVPVLRVDGPDKKLRAVVFGYACHNTTLGFQFWNGDYAGYAQEYFEAEHPGVSALFVTGCGADQNPYPRRTLDLAKRHGRSLATAIETAITANPTTLKGPLRAAYENVTLTYAEPPSREELAERMKSKNRFEASYAFALMDELNANGKLRESYPFPVQVVRIGDGLTLVGLGGETVVDYSLRLKRELGGKVWVAGYCNDVMAYIPSKRVLLEGGYEAGGAMRYFRTTVHPAYWHESLEERIIAKVHELNRRLR